MKTSFLSNILLFVTAGLLTTGCYTQLKTTERAPAGYTTASAERVAPERRAPLEEREGEIVNEEDYVLGYEDGWDDAEAYYFKDYEAKEWYLYHGATLAHSHSRFARTSHAHHYHHYYSPWYYSPFAVGHFYGYPRWRTHLAFSFHYGFHRPYYSGFYGFHRYPYYGPFFGGYHGFAGRGFYGHPIVIYTNRSVTRRSYQPRSTGLASRGNVRGNRSSAVTTQNSRSAVRSNARTTRVNNRSGVARTNRGTVNRTRGTSSVGSRSTGRSTNRGTVNRGSSNNRSSGSVNRNRSNNNRSSGTVNRSSSNNRSSGTVNRSSNNNRSSGSVNRSSTNRSSGSSANRSRSNNEQASAASVQAENNRTQSAVSPSRSFVQSPRTSSIISRSSLTERSSENRNNTVRVNRTTTVDNRITPPAANNVSVNARSSADILRNQSQSSSIGDRFRALQNSNVSISLGSSRSPGSATVNRTRSSSNTGSSVNRSNSSRSSSSGTVSRSSGSNNDRSSSSSRNRSSSNRGGN